MNLTSWIINIALRIYIRVACSVDAPDLHKVPEKGPLIFITNHTGRIEVPIFIAYLQPRPITAWAKAESWDNWFLRWVFGVWGVIPIHRGEADMSALKRALRAIEQGYIFGLAPEGTRNYTGILKRAMPGAVILALHSGAPLLPVAHWGGENYLKEFKRTNFHIRVGDLFKIKTAGVKMTGEVRQQIVDEMMCEIAKLLPEEYRGEYSDISKAPQYIQKL